MCVYMYTVHCTLYNWLNKISYKIHSSILIRSQTAEEFGDISIIWELLYNAISIAKWRNCLCWTYFNCNYVAHRFSFYAHHSSHLIVHKYWILCVKCLDRNRLFGILCYLYFILFILSFFSLMLLLLLLLFFPVLF